MTEKKYWNQENLIRNWPHNLQKWFSVNIWLGLISDRIGSLSGEGYNDWISNKKAEILENTNFAEATISVFIQQDSGSPPTFLAIGDLLIDLFR